jgi:DNA recombination protein RmuC
VTILAVLAGALLSGAIFYLVFFSARKNEEALRAQLREDMRQVMEVAETRQKAELDSRRTAVENAVGKLTDQLKTYEGLVREFEADRGQKYGSIEKGLKDAVEVTSKLASMLDNSRTRGQWGERMADDILRASGLQENVQYVHNRAQDASSSRPDFTFMLPQGHKVHMDVKFPLDNYVRMMNAKTEDERARGKADFLKDVKNRIKEIQKRDYINTAEGTLDYVLLFIPNEQVYGFIHESLPGLLDESLRGKVVLCSPSTLYAVLSVIRQAFDSFHFTQATQEIVKLISDFALVYAKFQERFEDLGERLDKARSLYDDIAQTSYTRLRRAIEKIEAVRRGQKEAPLPEERGALLDVDRTV